MLKKKYSAVKEVVIINHKIHICGVSNAELYFMQFRREHW